MAEKSPQEGLNADERSVFAKEVSEPALAATVAQEDPIAALVGGQPGAGKTTLVNALGAAFAERGGVFVVDPDLIRPGLPYMAAIVAIGGTHTPEVAYVDAGAIAFEMTNLAIDARRDILIDGTQANTDRTTALAKRFRDADYRVEFHGMAVYADLSHARTYERREAEIAFSVSGYGRSTDDAFHHEAVSGYRGTVQTFYDSKLVDRIALYDYKGMPLVDVELVEGRWSEVVSPVDVLDQELDSPSLAVQQEALTSWSIAAKAMAGRTDADPAELTKVEAFRTRAIANVAVPASVDGTYRGTVISADARTVIQQVGEGEYISHDRSNLFKSTSLLKPGVDVHINYTGKTGQVSDPEKLGRSHKRGR